MNIPAYPAFRPIEISDKTFFDKAFIIKPREISDFAFTNLYCWGKAFGFQVSLLDGFIIIRVEMEGEKRFFAPIGQGDVKAVVEKLAKGLKGRFVRVPEKVADIFAPDLRFIVEYDPDGSDYLYRMDDLASLPGRKYDGKRNHIKKFKADHSYEYVPFDGSNVLECLEFEETWCTIRNCESDGGLLKERTALKEMVGHFQDFQLIGGAIRVAGKICAVALGERLDPRTLAVHILKADPNIPGLYQVMMNEFLILNREGFEFVNLEEDLGIEGLRKSKLSYHPVAMAKKFIITPNTQKTCS